MFQLLKWKRFVLYQIAKTNHQTATRFSYRFQEIGENESYGLQLLEKKMFLKEEDAIIAVKIILMYVLLLLFEFDIFFN